ncbi:site-specific DNA-methyltransferase [Dehalococcoidia bacterium]|nr:site-specific DNA-methyltransferase [Dehalococcoidia bacterium]
MSTRQKYRDSSWDFRKSNTKQLTHCFHGYPAMMIPQVAGRLIDEFIDSNPCSKVLDPFCGSGTVLVEAKRRGLESWGIDINPLARLIAKAKTTPIDIERLKTFHRRFTKSLIEIFNDPKKFAQEVCAPDFFNIEYWFKPKVIEDLLVIKCQILQIKDKDIQDFYKVTFSETVRDCSNVRHGEFKLFRIPEDKLKTYNPNVLLTFLEKAERNFKGMEGFCKELSSKRYLNIPVYILDEDTRFTTSIPEGSVDLIVTSPPYGDSRTTVAYGQYSRLSLQWLDFDDSVCRTIDKNSLGGKVSKENDSLQISKTLNKVLKEIKEKDGKRALDILSFYNDMMLCLRELGRIMAKNSIICFVLGNRTVKSVNIPTDEILVDMFKHIGFRHKKTIVRDIPNKTMPLKNSPTNEPGKVEKTMWDEYIVIVGR